MRTIRVIIAGSRDFNDYEILKGETDAFLAHLKVVESFVREDEVIVVSGGARGADKLGERYAKEHGYHCEIYVPNWSIGKQAGILRNIDMAKVSQVCIVFNLNNSKGSSHMASHAKKQGIITKVVNCYV